MIGLAVPPLLSLCSDAASSDERTSSIGYPSVAAALKDLSSDPRASTRQYDGWTIIEVRETGNRSAIWSFTPSNHPAHPAAVKRTVHEENGAVMLRTSALCQATKSECDRLMEQFRELEQRMREHIRQGRT
jgi:hypothetical protein